jgi:hypothetical protein
MLEFQYIYLDSNPLLAAGWPRITEKLQTISELAKFHHLPLFLPVSVEEELEQHWIRDLSDKEGRIKQTVGDRNRVTGGVIDDLSVPAFPSNAVVRRSYREQVASLKKALLIQSSPFTVRPLQEVFQMSARRTLPFREKDKDFQDVVHILSVIDHLKILDHKTAALVSKDGVFETESVQDLERDSGVKLVFFKTLDELDERLRLELSARQQEALKTESQALLAKLEPQRAELATFIREHLAIPESELRVGAIRWALPRRADLVEISDVHIPPFQLRDRPPNEPLPITIDVKVEILATVGVAPVVEEPMLRIGQEDTHPSPQQIIDSFIKPEYREERIPLACEVEGFAMRKGQEIQGFKFTNVETKRSKELRWARAIAAFSVIPK